MRILLIVALLLSALPGIAMAQSGSRNASTSFLRTIQTADTGGARTIDGINNSVLNNSRAQVPQTGVNNFQAFNTSVSSGTPASVGPSFAPSSFSGTKPFAGASNGSTISPYLNLFRDDGFGGTDNYNTLVRPQLQQQRVNQELQRQTQALNRRVQQISAQGAFNTRGSEQVVPTGHSTGFRYYSHFYPALNRRR